jgi:hypothetical protein
MSKFHEIRMGGCISNLSLPFPPNQEKAWEEGEGTYVNSFVEPIKKVNQIKRDRTGEQKRGNGIEVIKKGRTDIYLCIWLRSRWRLDGELGTW